VRAAERAVERIVEWTAARKSAWSSAGQGSRGADGSTVVAGTDGCVDKEGPNIWVPEGARSWAKSGGAESDGEEEASIRTDILL
jgi:hypothetical protein